MNFENEILLNVIKTLFSPLVTILSKIKRKPMGISKISRNTVCKSDSQKNI